MDYEKLALMQQRTMCPKPHPNSRRSPPAELSKCVFPHSKSIVVVGHPHSFWPSHLKLLSAAECKNERYFGKPIGPNALTLLCYFRPKVVVSQTNNLFISLLNALPIFCIFYFLDYLALTRLSVNFLFYFPNFSILSFSKIFPFSISAGINFLLCFLNL